MAAIIGNADARLSAADVHYARIFVRADLDVAYQHVITVMDGLRRAGFDKVSILAQTADAPR